MLSFRAQRASSVPTLSFRAQRGICFSLLSSPRSQRLCVIFFLSRLSLPPYFLTSLPHQFHKHLIRNTQLLRSEPHQAAIPLHQTRRRQRIESCRQRHPVFPLNPPKIDPIQLPQSEKQFFFQRAFCRQRFMLFNRQSPALHGSHISRRIVLGRPSLCTWCAQPDNNKYIIVSIAPIATTGTV